LVSWNGLRTAKTGFASAQLIPPSACATFEKSGPHPPTTTQPAAADEEKTVTSVIARPPAGSSLFDSILQPVPVLDKIRIQFQNLDSVMD
jgi:hypothetical protein